MAIDLPLEKIEKKHLQDLVDLKAPESDSLEFKADYRFSIPDAKARAEFLKDVSAMANAEGGDFVIGMREDDDGNAKALGPTKEPNIQDFERQITAFCVNHLSPALIGVGVKSVPLSTGGYTVVIRVPQSWSAPHMVTLSDDCHHFFIRRVREVLKMTVEELRRRFLFADNARRSMRRYREEKVERLSDEMRNQSPHNAHLLLHFLPLRSFTGRLEYDMVSLFNDGCLSPSGGAYEWEPSYNFDGIEVVEKMQERTFRRTQIYRNGIVQISAGGIVANDQGRPFLNAPIIENVILKRGEYALRLLKTLQVQPPVFVGVSFVGVADLYLNFSDQEPLKGPLKRGVLQFDEVLLDTLDTPLKDAFRPLLNVMAQSFGLWKWP